MLALKNWTLSKLQTDFHNTFLVVIALLSLDANAGALSSSNAEPGGEPMTDGDLWLSSLTSRGGLHLERKDHMLENNRVE